MKASKFLVYVFIVVSICVISCSCDNQESHEDSTQNSFNVTSFKTNTYTFALPERIVAEKEDDGSVTFFLGSTEIGGITTIPYKNADQFFTDDFIENSQDDVYLDFVKLIVPDRETGYFFSHSEQGSFSLSIGDEDDSGVVLHYFFPDGDLFYDIFFNQKPVATPEEMLVLLNSFTINS